MKTDQRKIALIGAGLVGMSFAYAMLNQGVCDELVLIDIDERRAAGEAMDLNHGLAFSNAHMKIWAGSYSDCRDADIVVICAGVAQQPGESRIALLNRNAEVFRSIVQPVVASGFEGIFLIATNPVDIMTHIAWRLSGFEPSRVMGSGTTLDTARLRYMLGVYFGVNPHNVHAYVIGEHGESEFVPWSQAMISTKPVQTICAQSGGRYTLTDIDEISHNVRDAAQKIIAAKKATYYGVGMALVRIVQAILKDENSILTVSTLIDGAYGQSNVFAGVPAIIGRRGVRHLLSLPLTQDELDKLDHSCDFLRETVSGVKI